MKYGIYFAYWTKEWAADYKYYIDKVKRLGFDILEISYAAFKNGDVTDDQLFSLRDYAREKGILLTAGYGPNKFENIASENPEIVKNAFASFNRMLPLLHKLDIHLIGGGLYSYWPVDYSVPVNKEADLDRAIKNMREVAKIAEDNDIILGMEVLNRFEGYLINTCDEALDFVNAIGSNNIGVMLDTFHMNIEEDNIGAAIRKAADKLCHLHLGEKNRKVPGKGTMPWAEIGQALRDINYQHAAVMEPFVMEGGTIGSEIKVFRNLVEDTSEKALDKDAENSVRFVRHVFGL